MRPRLRPTIGLAAVLVAGGLAARAEEAPPSFTTDIQPILTKLGCNQGACHGAQHGKGSFKLSLRGFDDAADYREIVRGAFGRRISVGDPSQSLLLQKPTLSIPHEGGRRLAVGSPVYRMLERWISLGAPGPGPGDRTLKTLVVAPGEVILRPGETARIEPTATYEDGFTERPTEKASFDCPNPAVAEVGPDGSIVARGQGEAAVMVRYLGAVGVVRVIVPYAAASPALESFPKRNYIDEHWVASWRKLGLTPAGPCDDAEFFRRIHLSVLSTLPTPAEVQAFLADPDPAKRAKAIDAVLKRPEYVDAWAYKWGDLLLNSRRSLQKKGMWSLHNWLRASFRENRPLDRMVAEMVTAVGSPYENGPANFFGIGSADEWTESTAQVFLGVRLQCAKCHNHPFENILQSDYYRMKAYFGRVGKKSSQEFGLAGGDSVIFVSETGEVTHPRTGEVMKPRPIGGPPVDDPIDRRRALAGWMTARDNPALARNLANRYWGYFFGRGLIHPIDDIRVTNPPVNPELLDALAADLIAHDYDIKHLMRTIMNSQVYQLSAVAASESRVDVDNRYVTHYQPKRLSAETLLDAVDAACGTREKFPELPLGYRAIALPDTDYASEFLDAFGRPRRAVPCECERGDGPTMTQALLLISGGLLNRKVGDAGGRAARLAAAGAPIDQAVAELFLATVSRPPTADEQQAAREEIQAAPSVKEGLEDLLWTLLNTREFQFNH